MRSSCPRRTKFSLLPSSLKRKVYAAILEKDNKDGCMYVTAYVVKTNKKDIVADFVNKAIQRHHSTSRKGDTESNRGSPAKAGPLTLL